MRVWWVATTATPSIASPSARDYRDAFIIKAKGRSMEPKIFEGDLVIVRKSPEFINGNYVCVNNCTHVRRKSWTRKYAIPGFGLQRLIARAKSQEVRSASPRTLPDQTSA
jgi:Peptidase S24-like